MRSSAIKPTKEEVSQKWNADAQEKKNNFT